jgi:hypothetical protein
LALEPGCCCCCCWLLPDKADASGLAPEKTAGVSPRRKYARLLREIIDDTGSDKKKGLLRL